MNGNEYCYTCYYMIRGQRNEHDEEATKGLKERIQSLEKSIDYWMNTYDDIKDEIRNGIIELIKKQPQQIDRDQFIQLVEKELKRYWSFRSTSQRGRITFSIWGCSPVSQRDSLTRRDHLSRPPRQFEQPR